MKKIQELPRAYEAAQVEQHWYPIWEKSGYFTGNPDSAKPPYSIVIPPPNVTGILTLGHVLNNTLQDILCRRARMKGCEVSWFPGTDHAGIATESRVVKFLKETENVTRDELGREEFIRRVWKWRDEFGGKIIRQLRTLGCSCDWQKERFTMDEGLSNAVKKVFVPLHESEKIVSKLSDGEGFLASWRLSMPACVYRIDVEVLGEERNLFGKIAAILPIAMEKD